MRLSLVSLLFPRRLRLIEQKLDAALSMLDLISQREKLQMADLKSLLAKVAANTSLLHSVQDSAVVMAAGHASIAEEIAALKQQLADASVPVDFSALDTALDEQGKLIGGVADAILANTPPPAEPARNVPDQAPASQAPAPAPSPAQDQPTGDAPTADAPTVDEPQS